MNITKVTLRFSEDVLIGEHNMSLWGVDVPQVTISGFSYDSVLFLATWTLQGAGLGLNKWLLDLSDAVTDIAGNALDGDWTTGEGAFPSGSGNGVAGGRFMFRFNVLPGDNDSSGMVQSSDVIQVRNGQFKSTTTGGYNYRHDVNGNGLVQSSDLITTRNAQFTSLPDDEPLSGAAGSASAASSAFAAPSALLASPPTSPAPVATATNSATNIGSQASADSTVMAAHANMTQAMALFAGFASFRESTDRSGPVNNAIVSTLRDSGTVLSFQRDPFKNRRSSGATTR